MAVHAGLRRRNAREAGCLYRGVAVATIDAQAGDVMLMAERNRLRLANARIRHVGRTLNFVQDPAQGNHDEDRAKNRGAGQTIRTAMKNL